MNLSRTSSQTLYYWQADVGMFDDPKIVDLNDAYGPLGEAILFRIFDYIARTNGYFAQLNDALIIYLYRSVGSKWIKNKRIISEVIQFCGVCGLFDVNLLTQNVITSQGIQRRWLYAKKKDRARGFSTTEYWLLDEPLHGKAHSDENSCGNNTDNCSNNGESCNNNPTYKKRQEILPPISPKGGEGDEETRERFFTAYPKLKGLAKYEGINYAALYRQFEKSEFLRTRFSVNWVFENYGDIIVGAYADIPNGEEYMRAREAWYTARRDAAQALAEQNRKRAEQSAAFCEAERACKSAEISIAKAEAQGAADEAADAVKARENAVRVLKRELKNVGLTEKDLVPQWNCKKCSDTGFLPDGRACDCYEEKERC